jgi:hypothetical protein
LLVGCGGGSTGGGTGGGEDAGDATPEANGDDTGFEFDSAEPEACVPTTCAAAGANCDSIPDSCGNVLNCGTTCPDGQICGGNGTPNVCAPPPCTPKTCTDLGFDCGAAGDGCGHSLDCGACTSPDTCGGGGAAGKCGHVAPCVPKTCADQGISCGPAGDGCGKPLDCGSCTAPETCGGGGKSGVCGSAVCLPTTCAKLGTNCGPTPDGCGGLLDCGTCSVPQTCAGGGKPNICGIPPTCTNLCTKQVACPSGGTTSISGTVYAPNGVDPLPNALVYVPNAKVEPFKVGVTCDSCGASASGSPLVSTTSAVDGTFKLTNVPVGTSIPLVIQVGRWRRQITIASTTACANTVVDPTASRLPRNKGEGDIPLMAFATGSLDALECVMRKIGVDDSEFTAPTGTGRIHLFTGLDDPTSAALGGASAPGAKIYEDQLWSTQANLNRYDMVLFPCQGDAATRSATVKQNLLNFANQGGRIFATHFSYTWLYQTPQFSSTATWTPGVNGIKSDPQTGFIDQTFPKGALLAQWLQGIGASTTLGQISIQNLRRDVSSVIAPAQTWMTINDSAAGKVQMHYTFNTPTTASAGAQCGRVLFDDFHVEEPPGASAWGKTFPAECSGGAMTPQEKLLEFMLFDLASCVTVDVPTCKPKSCAELNVKCGQAGDGCGNIIACGDCPTGTTCGGGGVPSTCGAPSCPAKTCATLGISCGPAGDGCGGSLDCGTCAAGLTCGGGGKPGVCGTSACTPKTCADQSIHCGPAGDGCGNKLDCGSCPSGQTCGGGGTPGACGAPICTPKTCVSIGADCGPVADGCGHTIDCGTCKAPQTCGGNGTPNKCGGGIQ